MLPFGIVEDPLFQKIFNDFKIEKGDTKIKHLSRYSLGKRVEMNLTKTMNEVREHIKLRTEEGGVVCTTADMWTGGARRFLGVTVSRIDSKTLTRKSAALACRRFSGTHSFDAIAKLLYDIHTSLGLTPETIRATVTDNASNFGKAFRELGIEESDMIPTRETDDQDRSIAESLDLSVFEENLAEEDLVTVEKEFGEECKRYLPKHCKCASHTLNLIASIDTAKAIAQNDQLKRKHSSVSTKCTSLLKSMRSPKKREVLKLKLGIAIQRPVVTRWNSLYDFFKQLISIQTKLIDKDIVDLPKSFTISDFNYLVEYVRCSAPIANAIDLLQGDSCFYGILLPTLMSVQYKLKELLTNDDIIFCNPLLKVMIDGINIRLKKLLDFSETNIDAAIAAISHPRFKGRWLTQYNEVEQRTVHQRFIEAVTLQASILASSPINEYQDDDFQFGTSTLTIEEFTPSLSQGEIKSEVTRYLKSKESDLAMLEKFPNIRKTFLKYNTPLPSSAPVERLFSYATMLNLPKFNRLTDHHFEQRILAKANSIKKYI
ncbi:uncharacterized protein [Venturia canescens]|uniref:uncharacterized protein n=1 Tax=Venturia canescens TaxID=32260 RepID=UPI001C9C1156|nr:uncharacterized protein LOC122417461 [Venturia canescens]